MHSRRLFASLAALLVFVASASADPVVQAVVNQVSQTQYTHYLSDENFLYTHNGNSRRYTTQHDLARTNIVNTLTSFGLSPVLDPFTYNSTTYYNVVATTLGAVTPANIYIIGAHYDSVSCPGANDNASGVSAVLEAARVLSQYQFNSTLVFIAFDREEQGMKGSQAYAYNHRNDNILGMISADMISYRDPAEPNNAYVYSDYTTLRSAVASAINTYSGGLTAIEYPNESGTDNWYFGTYNKPNGFIEEHFDADPYYHNSADSVDTPGYIDYAYGTAMTKSAVGWLAEAAVVLPRIPGDADGNRLVNQADAAILAAHWGQTGGWSAGDFNADGLVNAADASVLAANWGYPTGETTTVPEPSTLVMLLLGLLPCAIRRTHSA
jgi:hypothetical protein